MGSGACIHADPAARSRVHRVRRRCTVPPGTVRDDSRESRYRYHRFARGEHRCNRRGPPHCAQRCSIANPTAIHRVPRPEWDASTWLDFHEALARWCDSCLPWNPLARGFRLLPSVRRGQNHPTAPRRPFGNLTVHKYLLRNDIPGKATPGRRQPSGPARGERGIAEAVRGCCPATDHSVRPGSA